MIYRLLNLFLILFLVASWPLVIGMPATVVSVVIIIGIALWVAYGTSLGYEITMSASMFRFTHFKKSSISHAVIMNTIVVVPLLLFYLFLAFLFTQLTFTYP